MYVLLGKDINANVNTSKNYRRDQQHIYTVRISENCKNKNL